MEMLKQDVFIPQKIQLRVILRTLIKHLDLEWMEIQKSWSSYCLRILFTSIVLVKYFFPEIDGSGSTIDTL